MQHQCTVSSENGDASNFDITSPSSFHSRIVVRITASRMTATTGALVTRFQSSPLTWILALAGNDIKASLARAKTQHCLNKNGLQWNSISLSVVDNARNPIEPTPPCEKATFYSSRCLLAPVGNWNAQRDWEDCRNSQQPKNIRERATTLH